MGDATLQVRFPDGTVRFGIYNGTSDVARPWLYDTSSEAWADRKHGRPWPTGDELAQLNADAVPVEIADDYGNGSWWPGRATHDLITFGYSPFDDVPSSDYHDGHPPWWVTW